MNDSKEQEGCLAPGWPSWFERFILPSTQESSLLVVWLVLLLNAVMFLAVVEIFAVRDRHPAGGLGLLFAVGASFEALRHDRKWHHKFGKMSATVLACWLASGVLALVASNYGVF